MSGKSRDPWVEEADKQLADGQWHDGLPWMEAVEKEIMPGPAARKTEADRIRATRRRLQRLREQELGRPLTDEEIHKLEVRERIKPLSMGAQIAAGKRTLLVNFVHTKVRIRAYQVDPWPMPPGGWKQGGWRLRRPIKWSMAALEDRYRITLANVRRLVKEAPALRYEMVGRIMYLPDEELPALEARIKAYREDSSQRRREAARERWRKTREAPATHYSVSVLAQQAGISAQSARRLQQAHPELGWVTRGRKTLLPLDRLPKWESVVKEFNATRRERRREANRRTARARADANRQRTAPGGIEVTEVRG